MSKSKESYLVLILMIVSALPRFLGLGTAHFYGDETKTLYLDKTVPALAYFLDQRKGPMQFFVTWVVEKLSGGYEELWIRLPFAVAGLFSVLVFYFVVRKISTSKVALLASVLYSFSGFSIAFSRTAQYQSFLILFGLLGFLAFLHYVSTNRKLFLILATVSYVLAFYCHYDAIFYLIPFIFIAFSLFSPKDAGQKAKELLIYFVLPFVVAVSIFYVPYVAKGYFSSNTLGYISRRLVGDAETLPNNSLYTFGVYNPFVLFLPFLLLGFLFSIRESPKKFYYLYTWFLVPFILFEVFFKSPGTHILHYFVPVYILAAVGWVGFISTSGRLYYFSTVLTVLILVAQIFSTYYIFVYNSNYPWVSSKFAFMNFPQAQKNYQLFLYGFPYNRSWPQVAEYLNSQKGARGFYTNDNTVLAKYYVRKLDVTVVASNFYPQYYVYVRNNQEFRYPTEEFLSHYSLVKQFGTDAVVYQKLQDRLEPDVFP